MIYDNRENLQLYINKTIKHLKISNDISIYIDDLEYGDDFIIGLIYRLRDTKHNKLYIGSEELARGIRQKIHIPTALYRYNKKMKLSKFQRHIINHKEELNIFSDEIFEIVIYKTIDKLYEREQNYIDLFDTIKNGLNTKKAKINDKNLNNKTRFIRYYKLNVFFRKYGRQILMIKDKANEILKLNLSFECYKDIIEDNKKMIEHFINLYCYNKNDELECYNILLNYILYEQKKRRTKYLYDKSNEKQQDNEKPYNKNDFEILLYKQIFNDKTFNENHIIIDFVENKDIININVIDTVIDII